MLHALLSTVMPGNGLHGCDDKHVLPHTKRSPHTKESPKLISKSFCLDSHLQTFWKVMLTHCKCSTKRKATNYLCAGWSLSSGSQRGVMKQMEEDTSSDACSNIQHSLTCLQGHHTHRHDQEINNVWNGNAAVPQRCTADGDDHLHLCRCNRVSISVTAV